MNADSSQIKHLEFLQGAITRINSNSFQVKGMAITIVSAMLAIYASNSKPLLILMGIPSSILFWLVDSYYIQLERKIRGIYNDVAGITNVVTVKPFEFPIGSYKNKDKKYNYLNCLFSRTIFPIYSLIVIGLYLFFLYITSR